MFKSLIYKSPIGRNKTIKEGLFFPSGYKSIMLTRTKEVNENIEDLQVMKMKEIYSKLFKLKPDRLGVGEYWRAAQVSDIRDQNVTCTASLRVQKKGIDEQLLNEASCLIYLEFRNLRVKDNIDVSIKSVSRIDTIMTTTVDEMTWATEIYIFNTTNIDITQDSQGIINKLRRTRILKWDKVPAQSRRCVQQVLLTVIAHVLQDVLKCLKEYLCERPDQIEIETPVHSHESILSHLKNDRQEYTYAFQNPLSKFHYIAMTQYTFAAFIYSWIGIACDCYFLYTNSLQETFDPFKLISIQDHVESEDKLWIFRPIY